MAQLRPKTVKQAKIIGGVTGITTRIDENAPEYYCMAGILTDEEADVAIAAGLRKERTAAYLARKVGKTVQEVQPQLDNLVYYGIFRRSHNETRGEDTYYMQIFAPGILEMMVIQKELLDTHPEVGRAFEEYMERVRTGEAGCLDAVLTYIRLEGLNARNARFGLQAGDEAVVAAARCVADFCRACEDGGESVSCFRTGGNEFALIRPEPRANSGQLHRQFSAIVARYTRTCAPRARSTMTYGFSRLCDEDGKSRSISAWKAEADAYLKRNESRLGGDTE